MKDRRLQIVAVIAAGIILYWLARSLVSDETKIRWQIESAVESFNLGRARSCAEVMAEDFRDATSGANKQLLQQYLLSLFLRQQNRKGDLFRYPVELVEEALEIRVEDDEQGKAEVRGKARFRELGVESPTPLWEIDFSTEFSSESGDWLAKKSTFKTLGGNPPF